MRGGFTYGNSSKKFSKQTKSKTKTNSKMKSKNIYAGRTRKHRYHRKKMTYSKHKKNSKHRKKSRKYKQKGGSNLNYAYLENVNNQIIQPRLPEGVYFNNVQGYGADLNNPPLEGIETVTQCNSMQIMCKVYYKLYLKI